MRNCEDCTGYICNWDSNDDRRFCPRFEIVAWFPSNVYKTARLGFGVSIGRFVEIGNDVEIGNYTRIGKGAFIPEGVKIGENVFIGPHACFSNDLYPPGDKKDWKKTLVKNKARIGANTSILPGIIIGEESLLGMGSVLTKSLPKGEIWAGNPAKKLVKKKGWPKGKKRK